MRRAELLTSGLCLLALLIQDKSNVSGAETWGFKVLASWIVVLPLKLNFYLCAI